MAHLLRVGVFLAAAGAASFQASAGGCQTSWFEHDPCVLEINAVRDTSASAELTLTLFNSTAESKSWVVAPAVSGDPDCLAPFPGGTLVSYAPFSGNVPGGTISSVAAVDVTVDATGLEPGTY
jgi:hypothetical protein